MKKIKFICSILFLIVVASSCNKQDGIDQDTSFLSTIHTANLAEIIAISNDNSGKVKITPVGEGVASFKVNFGHGDTTDAFATVKPGYSSTHVYPEGNYTVSIVATDLAGKSVTNNYPFTITYREPENLVVTIDGDMVVSAAALYAKSFLVYYGDVTGEAGTPMEIGEKLPAHIYPDGGPYSLKVVALSGGAAKTEKVIGLFGSPITFEDPNTNYFFGTFGANQLFEKVSNPDISGINTSATVGMLTRGYEAWSGTYSPLNIPMNFAYGKKVKVWAYNPAPALVGKKLNVELESAVGGFPANGVAVLKVPVTKSGEWEELVFDFSTIASIPANTRFGQLILRFNDTALGAGAIIYVDNIRFTN